MKKAAACFIFSFFLLGRTAWGQMPAPGTGSFSSDSLSKIEQEFSAPPLSAEEEYYLGRAVAANILSTFRPYTGNPELTAYLNFICQSIAINSPKPTIFNGYHLVILDPREYNAFASPGGHIMITRGLLEAAASEDALAALIAHELAHIILGHAESIIAHMNLNNELNAIASRAASISGNYRAAQQAALLRNSASAIVDTMVKNGYSQDQELEADKYALILLASSGYDPRGLLEILEVLRQVQTDQKGGFNSTHPSPVERINNVNNYITVFQPSNTRPFRAPRFKNK